MIIAPTHFLLPTLCPRPQNISPSHLHGLILWFLFMYFLVYLPNPVNDAHVTMGVWSSVWQNRQIPVWIAFHIQAPTFSVHPHTIVWVPMFYGTFFFLKKSTILFRKVPFLWLLYFLKILLPITIILGLRVLIFNILESNINNTFSNSTFIMEFSYLKTQTMLCSGNNFSSPK